MLLLPENEQKQLRSEIETAFTDSIPSNAVNLPYSRLLLEMPCGVETEFDRTGDGVRILHLHLQPGDGDGLTIVHDGA